MDGLVEELLRLEGAKHQALVSIDAPAYDANVREQLSLLCTLRDSAEGVSRTDRLLALARMITLNTRLLQNLLSTTPLIDINRSGYTATGQIAEATVSRSVSVEV